MEKKDIGQTNVIFQEKKGKKNIFIYFKLFKFLFIGIIMIGEIEVVGILIIIIIDIVPILMIVRRAEIEEVEIKTGINIGIKVKKKI